MQRFQFRARWVCVLFELRCRPSTSSRGSAHVIIPQKAAKITLCENVMDICILIFILKYDYIFEDVGSGFAASRPQAGTREQISVHTRTYGT